MRAPILLKLSGEALGDTEGILDPVKIDRVCQEMVAGSQNSSNRLALLTAAATSCMTASGLTTAAKQRPRSWRPNGHAGDPDQRHCPS